MKHRMECRYTLAFCKVHEREKHTFLRAPYQTPMYVEHTFAEDITLHLVGLRFPKWYLQINP